jgi:hypothetical protein
MVSALCPRMGWWLCASSSALPAAGVCRKGCAARSGAKGAAVETSSPYGSSEWWVSSAAATQLSGFATAPDCGVRLC